MKKLKTFLVGGAVRDVLMGIESNDKDYVVVGSTPQEMLGLGFSQVGTLFPVFLHPETNDEYALARTERKSGNGYNGFTVNADPDITLDDDLSRRDLTINAIAYNEVTKEFTDPFGGVEDIKNKILKHVSPAFADDPLRVIRLARFASRFPIFSIHPDTLNFAKNLVDDGELNHITSERFWAEILKTFKSGGNVSRFFEVLVDLDAFNRVKFFNDIWGSVDGGVVSKFKKILDTLQEKNVSPENAANVFVALTATPFPFAKLDKASSELMVLHRNVANLRKCDPEDANSIFKVLHFANAYSNSIDAFALFKLATEIECTSDRSKFLNVHLILNVFTDAFGKNISAADFPGLLPGKELGDKIREARISAIQDSLTNLM